MSSWLPKNYDSENTKTSETYTPEGYAPNGKYWLKADNHTLPEVVVTGKDRSRSTLGKIWDTIKDTDVAYIDNPSVMTAAGHTAKLSEMHWPTEAERKLGDNLAVIGFAGATEMAAPVLLSTGSATINGVNAAGDALAATAAGQRLTSGLNFVANAARSSKAWPWIDAGLTSAFGAQGIDKVRRGDIHNVGDVVETGLDLMPLAQLVRPVVNTASRVGNAVETATNRTLLNTVQKNILGEPIVPDGLFKASPYEGYNYFHGGLEPDFDFNTLDVFRLGSKQGKRGKDYAGFYMHNDRDKLHAFGYGQGEAHGIKVADNAKVLKLNQNVERMTQSELKQYRDQGYDMITGSNIWGEPEYILLNKDIVEDTKFFYEPPKNELRLFKAPRSVLDKKSKSPTVEWTEAARTPQITAENAASITPKQWTTAQDAAIARGDMAEAQRLRDLHFKTKASKNKLIDGNGNPVAVKHHGNVWNVFDPDKTMSGTLWTANEDAFKLNDIKTFPASDLPTEWKNLYINMENPIQDEVGIGTTRMLSEIRKGSKDAIKESIRDYGVSNPDGVFNRIKITEDFLKKNGYDLNDPEIRKILNNPEFYGKEPTMAATAYPNNIKSADAVTYDDKGVRIPLGERDNFKLNDIRYSWLAPFIGLGTLGTLLNKQ